MRPKPFNPYLLLYLILVVQLFSLAIAHENQLSGLLYMHPQTPIPEQPFTVTLELINPNGAYIRDAIVNLSISDLDFKQQFTETSQTGIYKMNLSLPDGKWLTEITESTFENEANSIELGINSGSKNRDIIELLFPVVKEPKRFQQFIIYPAIGLFILTILVLYLLNSKFFITKSKVSYSKTKTVNTQS